MKRAITILVIAVIHLVLAVGSVLKSLEFSGFIFGLYPQPEVGPFHSTLMTMHTVLMFPLGLVAESLGPGVQFLAWPLVMLNSLLWAAVLFLLLARWFPPRRL